MSSTLARRFSSLGRNRSEHGNILVGCLAVLGVLFVLAVIGVIIVVLNWRSWTASGSMALLDEALQESSLPQDQRDAIRNEAQLLADDFKAGNVSPQELVRVFEELAESPIIPATVIGVMTQEYVEPSELDEEAKLQARLTIQRLARGVYEEKIELEQLNNVTDPLAARQGDKAAMRFEIDGRVYTLQQPEDVTTEELTDFLERARAAADEADVPDEPYQIDVATEVRKAIDRGLGREATDAPLPPPEPEPVTDSDVENGDRDG